MNDGTAFGDGGTSAVALTPVDQMLLDRCLKHRPGAWNDFVDRFLGLIYHVIHYTAHLRSAVLRPEDVEDLAAEILLQIVANDYAVLRQFRGHSSLATYLTVIARRIAVHTLANRATAMRILSAGDGKVLADSEAPPAVETGLDVLEEVHQLLAKLPRKARRVVRLYYLEGRSYEDISTELNIPINSIGPILTRAKQYLRRKAQEAKSESRSAGAVKR
jgi:RNA polymerase sigma-70 factor (ECF subfamily)